MVVMINRRAWSDDANSNRWRQISRSFWECAKSKYYLRNQFQKEQISTWLCRQQLQYPVAERTVAWSFDSVFNRNQFKGYHDRNNDIRIWFGTILLFIVPKQWLFFTTPNNDHPVLAKAISSYSDSQKYDTFSFG